MRDLYHDLGVAPDASSKAIRAAYDWVRTNRSEASGSYRLAVESFAVLGDPVARAAYDRQFGKPQEQIDVRTEADAAADSAADTAAESKGHQPKHASIDVTGGHSWLGFLGRKR